MTGAHFFTCTVEQHFFKTFSINNCQFILRYCYRPLKLFLNLLYIHLALFKEMKIFPFHIFTLLLEHFKRSWNIVPYLKQLTLPCFFLYINTIFSQKIAYNYSYNYKICSCIYIKIQKCQKFVELVVNTHTVMINIQTTKIIVLEKSFHAI